MATKLLKSRRLFMLLLIWASNKATSFECARQASFVPKRLASFSPTSRKHPIAIPQQHDTENCPCPRNVLPLFLRVRGGNGGGDENGRDGTIAFNESMVQNVYQTRALDMFKRLTYLSLSVGLVVSILSRRVAILHIYDPDVAVNSNSNSSNCTTPLDDKLLYGLNVPREKFRAWVGYHVGGANCVQLDAIESRLFIRKGKLLAQFREGNILHRAWQQGRLLRRPSAASKRLKGRIDFAGDQFMEVLEDESEDESNELMRFMQTECGRQNITRLEAPNWNQESDEKQLEIMQHFLDWFRSTFPYYYDKCDACGASSLSAEETLHTLLGLSCPSNDEKVVGKASHVEFFSCPNNCGAVTRFPRFNAAMSICKNRRGRCGEYNLLLLRMLQALGHTCRYVDDCRNGHVWSEVAWTDGSDMRNNTTRRWLHLDPCEAAVNKKGLYEEWGRRISCVLAFCAPPFVSGEKDHLVPVIEDVTEQYASKKLKSWLNWGRKQKIDYASKILRDKIAAMKERKNLAEHTQH